MADNILSTEQMYVLEGRFLGGTQYAIVVPGVYKFAMQFRGVYMQN